MRYNSPMSPRILCVGCIVVDEIFRLSALPAGDGKFFASERHRALGGMSAAAAAAIRALGGGATLWATVGDDREADFLRKELRRLGVRPRLLRRKKTASSYSVVCLDSAGRRMIVNRAPPALFAPPEKSQIPSLRGFRAVLADVRWPGGSAAVLRAARHSRIPAVLDWETVPNTPSAELRKLARHASHVVFSADGLRQFSETSGQALRPLPALRAAADFTGARVAVTRGERGAMLLRENGAAASVPAPKVAAQSTLGAGDAFHGACALALAEGKDFESALAFAAAAAAAKCALSAGEFPARREVEKLLRQNASQ